MNDYAITDFHGDHYWLDNMFLSPIQWTSKIRFEAVEYGFVYFKTLDPRLRKQVLACSDPYEAKALGRSPGFMRSDWDDIKFGIMYQLLDMKFKQNHELLLQLIFTNKVKLIEGNTWDDNIWGDCTCSNCRDIPGQNFLGKFLMSLRAQYQEGLV